MSRKITLVSGSVLPVTVSSGLQGSDLKSLSLDSKSLNLKSLSDLPPDGFSTDLAAELSLLVSDLPIENVPQIAADGIELPPEFAERLLDVLSNPAIAQQLKLDPVPLQQLTLQLREAIQTGTEQRFSPDLLQSLRQGLARLESNAKTAGLSTTEAKQLKELATDFNQSLQALKSQPQQDLIAVPRLERLTGQSLLLADGQSRSELSALSATHLHQANSHLTQAQANARPYFASVAVDTPLARPQWQEAFNSRVVMLAQDHRQAAQILINPPELGPVEIRLNMNAEQTHIQFLSQHSVVREAIEDAFPKLREMMNQTGVNLGDVNVSDQKTGQEFSDDNQYAAFSEPLDGQNHNDTANASVTVTRVQVQVGLIDHYV